MNPQQIEKKIWDDEADWEDRDLHPCYVYSEKEVLKIIQLTIKFCRSGK